MAQPEVLFIHLYRSTMGDLDIQIVPTVGTPIESAKLETQARLLNFHKAEANPRKKPLTAALVNHKGELLAEYSLRLQDGRPTPIEFLVHR